MARHGQLERLDLIETRLATVHARACSMADGWAPHANAGAALTSLNLSGWSRALDTLVADASHLPQLTTLLVAQCDALRTVELALPRLTKLIASKCPALDTARLNCPLLTELSFAHSKTLHAVHLSGEPPVGVLSLFGCRTLNREPFRTLLATVGATLRSLDINGTLGTREISEDAIRQACPHLEHLDARGRALKF